MAFRHALRQRNALPMAAGALAATVLFHPQSAYAEEPEAAKPKFVRKPIYDDPTPTTPVDTAPSVPPAELRKPPTAATSPSPTDRLTVVVGRARLQLYEYSTQAEAGLNDLAARAFNLEHNLTSTIQSLAPGKSTNEHLMPGAIYVLVSAMAGSILTRNRGIILRTIIPTGLGITAGYYLIPHTMHNIERLIWSWEEQYPVVRDTHIDVQERIERVVETGKAHTQMTIAMAEENLASARRKMEEWVSQGK